MLLYHLFQIVSWILFSRWTVVFPVKQKPPTCLLLWYLLNSTTEAVVRVSMWNEQDLCYKIVFLWYVALPYLLRISYEFLKFKMILDLYCDKFGRQPLIEFSIFIKFKPYVISWFDPFISIAVHLWITLLAILVDIYVMFIMQHLDSNVLIKKKKKHFDSNVLWAYHFLSLL